MIWSCSWKFRNLTYPFAESKISLDTLWALTTVSRCIKLRHGAHMHKHWFILENKLKMWFIRFRSFFHHSDKTRRKYRAVNTDYSELSEAFGPNSCKKWALPIHQFCCQSNMDIYITIYYNNILQLLRSFNTGDIIRVVTDIQKYYFSNWLKAETALNLCLATALGWMSIKFKWNPEVHLISNSKSFISEKPSLEDAYSLSKGVSNIRPAGLMQPRKLVIQPPW